MLVRIQSSALIGPDGVADCIGPSEGPGPGSNPGRDTGYEAPCECAGRARQCSELQDEVRFLGEALKLILSLECAGFARDSAKVEDQVQFLARTLAMMSL